MAGLLDILGANSSGAYGGLLGEEDLTQAKRKAQADALLNLSASLFKAGAPSRTPQGLGLGLVEGLRGAQSAYSDSIKSAAQEKLLQQKIAQEQQSRKNTQTAGTLLPQLQRQGVSPSDPLMDIYGKEQAGPSVPQAGGIDRNVLNQLMATPEGREQLTQFGAVQKTVRQLGLSEQSSADNPFKMFLSDPAMPPALKNLANQLSSSYEKGLIDPEKVDERVRQLAQMQQAAQDRAAGRQQQESMARLTASLRPERMVTVMGLEGQPVTVPQSQSGNQPLYSPAASKEIKETKSKAEAKNQLSALVFDLGSDYDTLKKSGSIVSSSGTGVGNIGARISSSGVGQFFGGTVGTEAQSTRQAIAQKRPLLLNLIKNATGMSAQQMNSNAEMQLYLQAATDPTLSYEANMSALENLDKMFGLGQFKAGSESDDNPFGKK